VAEAKVHAARDAEQVRRLLDLPEVTVLVRQMDALRWTGRTGYGARAMVGMALVKSLYCIPVWTRVAALVRDHAALRDVIGAAPSEWACYRFARRLREHHDLLADCLDAVVARLAAETPGMGDRLAIDGSDLPAYGNGQRHLFNHGPLRERFADPDASWGHRSSVGTRKGGGFYGFKVHAAVDTATELPVAWTVTTARESETGHVAGLIDSARRRGMAVGTCTLDKGYDVAPVYATLAERDVRPVIPLRMTGRVVRGLDKPPSCEHGEWRFAGADAKRQATKWRCPTAGCAPASRWVKADRLHPLIPRETARYKALYRERTAVERGFGRLKNEWGALPLRVRGLDRVRLHVDLTMLTCLGTALDRAGAARKLAA
jgi:transposase